MSKGRGLIPVHESSENLQITYFNCFSHRYYGYSLVVMVSAHKFTTKAYGIK